MNEWYRFNQNYIKLLVSRDGPCRVYKTDLVTAGVPNLATLDPDNLQVIYRGKEIAIRVQKTVTDELDFFEFEGRRNDGGVDSLMYRSPYSPFVFDPEQQPNRYRSFFTDTSAYFVTWDSVGLQRRTVIQPTNYGAYSPETSYRCRLFEEYTNYYFEGGGGRSDANHVLNPDYITGEGWVSQEFETGDIADVVARGIQVPGFIPGGTPSRMQVRAFGINASDLHVLGVSLNGIEIYRDTTYGITISTRTFTTSLSLPPQVYVRFQAFGNGARPDKQIVSWFTFEYNRNFDLAGTNRVIVRDWAAPDTTYLRFTNADATADAWIWDPVNRLHIAGTVSGDTLKFLVPGSNVPRDLYVYTDKALQTPIVEPQTSLANLSDTNAGAEFLIITHSKFANSANQYATYRDTNTVNRLSSKVVFIDQIYDEFGYGSMTTMAVKHFVKYALDNWAVKPRYVLLWGKGQYNPRLDALVNYVPSFGKPANDHEYVSNFSRTLVDFEPLAPVGRVCIYDDAQGLDYLNKVMEYEHMPYEGWMKEAVFLGGGKVLSEQLSIQDALLDKFMPPFEAAPMGGKVYWFQKKNNGIEDNSDFQSHNLIDEGVGLIQFFGHSSTNIFDVDILEASRYRNFKKYPFMVAFGCYGGDFVQRQQSFGERFVLEPNRGSIGYLANSTEGFLGQLREYGQALYQNMNGSRYGFPIGDVVRETIRQFAISGNGYQNILTANHCKQLNLQGDPSVVLRFPQMPDLAVSEPRVWFTPEVLNAEDANFSVNVAIENQGRSFTDSFVVRISQRLPSGQLVLHDDTIVGPVALLDTFVIPLANTAGRAMAGSNTFIVEVDALDTLTEYLEENNIVEKQTIVQGSTPALIYPFDFAIVGDANLRLIAGSYVLDRRASLRYTFEIDTVHTFNSGFKQISGPVMGNSVSGEWQLPFGLVAGKVYYWRVRFTDTYPVQWSTASFKYIPGKQGWAQSRQPQFFLDPTSLLSLDTVSREWRFDIRTEQLHAFIHSSGRPEYFFSTYGSNSEPSNGLVYTSINRQTLVPDVQNTTFGDWRYLPAPTASNPHSISDLVSAISGMNGEDYFLLVTSQNPRFNEWREEYLRALEMVGVDYNDLKDLGDGDRAVILGRKGGLPGSAIVITEPNLAIGGQTPRHDLLINLSTNSDSGMVWSPWIGPAKAWSDLNFFWHPDGSQELDTLQAGVIGQGAGDAEIRLRDGLDEGSHNLSNISAQAYRRLRLEGSLEDSYRYTAPQLDNWEVYYTPAPDMALDPNNHFIVPDTITEGQIVNFQLGLRNLTPTATDSVTVRYSLQRADRSEFMLGEQRYAPLAARGEYPIGFRFHSASKDLQEGLLYLNIELNPDQEQVEQHYFNNSFSHPIYVRTDKVGPVLNVTVDGKYLIEGDIVQPNPEIVIEINDENPYLPVSISDSTYYIWFGTERSYQFNPQLQIETDPRMEATAGRLPENKAQLTFTPGRLADGEYTLAVQSRDFKGNPSGEAEYVIHFNVESEKAISEVIPYPNPFSTSARFVYTLTGDEKPYVFELHIFTITGRLVKVIDLLELGQVHFGYNMTDYAWDGRDEFGDLLANGVYIYKTKVKFRDRYGVKQIDQGLSEYFKNGYGKLYILR